MKRRLHESFRIGDKYFTVTADGISCGGPSVRLTSEDKQQLIEMAEEHRLIAGWLHKWGKGKS